MASSICSVIPSCLQISPVHVFNNEMNIQTPSDEFLVLQDVKTLVADDTQEHRLALKFISRLIAGDELVYKNSSASQFLDQGYTCSSIFGTPQGSDAFITCTGRVRDYQRAP